MTLDEFCVLMRQRRKDLGISQGDVAKLMNSHPSVVGNLELGITTNPMLSTLDRWARALGFEVDLNLTK